MLEISVDESEEWLRDHVSQLASSASEKLGKRIEFTPAEVLANADYCASGTRRAILLLSYFEICPSARTAP